MHLKRCGDGSREFPGSSSVPRTLLGQVFIFNNHDSSLVHPHMPLNEVAC